MDANADADAVIICRYDDEPTDKLFVGYSVRRTCVSMAVRLVGVALRVGRGNRYTKD